jgi:hypothetical protein
MHRVLIITLLRGIYLADRLFFLYLFFFSEYIILLLRLRII